MHGGVLHARRMAETARRTSRPKAASKAITDRKRTILELGSTVDLGSVILGVTDQPSDTSTG